MLSNHLKTMLNRHLKSCRLKELVDHTIVCSRTFSFTTPRYSEEGDTHVSRRQRKEQKWLSSIFNSPFVWFSPRAPEATDFSLFNLRRWWQHVRENGRAMSQAYNEERHDILGTDVASAYFILKLGGKVKFKHDKKWLTADDGSTLPNVYDSKYIMIALDASGLPLVYEGMDNLRGLFNLQWLSLKGCKYVDDWCLDKISAELPRLEHLDISDCEKITERGLESLYRMFSLKTLIVTNHYKSLAFELTCLMLEECIPQLTCTILEPNETITEEQ